MGLGNPLWLLLVLVLPWVWWLGKRSLSGLPTYRRYITVALRMAIITLLAVAAAELQSLEETDELTVFYVLDSSKSMPEKVRDAASGKDVELKKGLLSYMRDSARNRKPFDDYGKEADDKVGLIVFGRDAQMEKSPDVRFDVRNVHTFLSRDYTNLEAGIRLADAAFPSGSRKRMVVFTDGTENIGSAIDAARAANGHGVDVRIYPIRYPRKAEVLVERLVVPPEVRLAETFPVRVVLSAHQDTEVEIVLMRDGEMARAKPLRVLATKGKSAFRLVDEINEAVGFHHYEVHVTPLRPADDTIRENNVAHGYTHIESEASVLLVARDREEARPLMDALRGEQIAFDLRRPEAMPVSRNVFQDYDCVILANVNAGAFTGTDHMRMLEGAVRNAGVGLIMIGGDNSFGSGGYLDTPIEECLPVDMDIKNPEVEPNGALAIILHTCEIAKGNYWAKRTSKAAINALGGQDLVGVIYYGWGGTSGGGTRWLFKMTPASQRGKLFKLIDKCSPGDMPDFRPAMQKAYAGLMKASASAKHCIIISDGDAQPASPALVKKFIAAKITISTVGIGIQNHGNVPYMKQVARSTGGRYYQPKSNKQLPQIFVKEAAQVRRSVIWNQPFTPGVAHYHELIAGFTRTGLPQLEALVLTTPKSDPKVQVPLVAKLDGNISPVLAHWKYGLGKTTAFTSDATTNWGKHWVGWSRFGNFWTQIIRGTMRHRKAGEIQITTRIKGDKGQILVDAIDDDGQYVNFLELSGTVELPDSTDVSVRLQQAAPGRYQGEFPAEQVGTYHVTARYLDQADNSEKLAFSGASVSYSPEYRSFESNDALLDELASISGRPLLTGDPKKDLIFEHDQKGAYTAHAQWPKLLILAGLLFLLDVFFRRVLIDWVKVYEAAGARWSKVAALFGGKTERRERSDPTMAALLKKKQELQDSAPVPIEVKESDFLSALKTASAKARDEINIDLGPRVSGAGEVMKAVEQAARRDKEEPPADDEPIGFTARLLDAKRRADEERRRGKHN